MSITIPACDVRKGDVIDFGGQPFIVTDIQHSSYNGKVIVSGCSDEDFGSDLRFLSDALLNVQRPDPDAELIGALADVLRGSFGGPREAWLNAGRDALLAIRETHDITPRADA